MRNLIGSIPGFKAYAIASSLFDDSFTYSYRKVMPADGPFLIALSAR